MSLQEKYSKVVSAAQSAEINGLKVVEQDGILYISGNTSTSAAKKKVWDAYGEIDASYSAPDINIEILILSKNFFMFSSSDFFIKSMYSNKVFLLLLIILL